MNKNEIWQAVELELRKAKKKLPNLPDHVAAQAGRVVVESGKLLESCFILKYSKKLSEMDRIRQKDAAETSGVLTIVEAIRFLENLK